MNIDEASLKFRDEQAGQIAGRINYQRIARAMEELPVAISNRIVRERRSELGEPLFLHLELLVQISRDTWDSIRFLCGEKPNDRRHVEFVYTVPPLSRTILDSLLTLIFVFDDRATNSRWYYAGGWRDRYAEHQRLWAKSGSDPAWKTWFEASAADIEQLEKLAGISAAEKQNPKLIKYWPNPGKFGRAHPAKDPKRQAFLEFLNEWFYGTLSGDSHLSFPGLIRRGGFYARLADGVDLPEHHLRARSQFLFEALSLHVALLSEISGELSLEHEKTRLRLVWDDLKLWPDAGEFFARRYDDWLR